MNTTEPTFHLGHHYGPAPTDAELGLFRVAQPKQEDSCPTSKQS